MWARYAVALALGLGLGCGTSEPSPPGAGNGGPGPHSDDAATTPRRAAESPVTDVARTPVLGTTTTPPARTWFTDVTTGAGIDLDRVPADDFESLPDRMSGGVCVIDVDGTPPLDLFFAVRPADGTGSRLYVARAAFDYVDETDDRGLADVGDPMGCLAFDADTDGDDDLLITGLGTVRLYEHVDGRFHDASDRLGFVADPRDLYAGAAAGDVDGDGDSDLVVAGFVRFDPAALAPDTHCHGVPCEVSVQVYEPLPNLLFLADANGGFRRDETVAPELAVPEPTLVISISQIVGDLTPEIYVGNDLGTRYRDRVLVRGLDRTYADSATWIGMAESAEGHGIDSMGLASGDIDGDGDLDHAATDYENRVTALFVCDATGHCEDEGPRRGMESTASSFRWGNALADFDLDGDLDMIEATGHVFRPEDGHPALADALTEQLPNLLENVGSGHFAAVAPSESGLDEPRATRGIAVADLDDDGRLDVVLAPARGAPLLLRNTTHAEGGHYLRLVLGRELGVMVHLEQRGRTWIRQRALGEGYLGNSEARVHFGLPYDAPVSITVLGPEGIRAQRASIAVDRELRIASGG